MALEKTPWREFLIENRRLARSGTAWESILRYQYRDKQGHRAQTHERDALC